jgi:hypothetical protein
MEPTSSGICNYMYAAYHAPLDPGRQTWGEWLRKLRFTSIGVMHMVHLVLQLTPCDDLN